MECPSLLVVSLSYDLQQDPSTSKSLFEGKAFTNHRDPLLQERGYTQPLYTKEGV